MANADLLHQVESSLLHHRKAGDQTAIDVLNRLVNKLRTRGEQGIPSEALGRHNCKLDVEWLTTDDLAAFRRHSKSKPPQSENAVIILVSFDGNRHLIDGGSRINKWVTEHNRDSHRTIVIEHQTVLEPISDRLKKRAAP